MALLLGDMVPDFTAETTTGPISFHDWIGNDWAFFFSHPADWRPGDRAIIPPSVSDEQASQKFPQGYETIRPYLRTVDINAG